MKPSSFSEVNLSIGEDEQRAIPDSETPFCIVMLGDFSGRENRSLIDRASIAGRRALAIDRDNFDEVMAKLAPSIQLPIGDGDPIRITFSELDDFHPDRLLEKVEAFRKLQGIRERLADPSSFAEAAKELGLAETGEPSRALQPKTAPAAPPSVRGLTSGSLLDDMIAQTEAQAAQAPTRRAPDDVREFARRVAEPHLVNAPDARQKQVLAVVDHAMGGLMRAILHNSDFQVLESAWRAVFLLVRRIETDSQLKLYLIDLSKQELSADLSSADLRSTGLYRRLVEQSVGTLGAEPWAVIAGNYTFGPTRQDAEALGRMAQIASAAGAPFLAAASARLAGVSLDSMQATQPGKEPADSDGDGAWAELRGLREAEALGLAMPRFLLRLPYGKQTDAVESFDFEEMPTSPAHEDYLWGNPAFACTLMLAQSFRASGWEMRPGTVAQIDGLPLHVYGRQGESELKPCAEVLLTETAVEQLLELGVMPLVSFKGRDSARIARFQSFASPPRPLAGRWAR